MKMIKKICSFTVALVLFLSLSLDASAQEVGTCWYIRRNGNKRPEIQAGQEIIYNYNGYFIDKKCTDEGSDKVLYLTFDLGYENGNAEKILDALNAENIKAAFFVLDNIILKNTELVTRMKEEGHLICNHTKNHKNLCKMTDEEIKRDITDLEKLYQEKTGFEMDKFFRFPEGRYSENALRCIDSMGYKTVFWSFAYDDWDNNRQMNGEKAISKVLSNTHNGAVMLFHPTSKTNADIFPTLISEWRKMGYRFGTLYDLVG